MRGGSAAIFLWSVAPPGGRQGLGGRPLAARRRHEPSDHYQMQCEQDLHLSTTVSIFFFFMPCFISVTAHFCGVFLFFF